MLVAFGIFEIEIDDSTDIVIAFVDGEFDSFTFFVSVLKHFLFLLFVKHDIDINGAAESTEKVSDFILRLN